MKSIIRYITNEKIKPDKKSLGILKNIKQLKDIHSIIILPDIHYKHSYHTPTGVAIFTKNRIFPKFINPNCAISFITTPLKRKDISNEQIDQIFNFLKKKIAITTRTKPNLSLKELKSILLKGAEPVYNKYGLNKSNLKNLENKGNIFFNKNKTIERIMKIVPKESIEMGLRSFGVLGFGNHFLELQRVKRILEPNIAKKFGLEKDQICIMLHSDSRAFGRSVHDHYSKKTKKLFGLHNLYKKVHYKITSNKTTPEFIRRLLEKLNYYANRIKFTLYFKLDFLRKSSSNKFGSLNIKENYTKNFIDAIHCAINFGYANRAYMISIVQNVFQELFSKKVELNILCDCNHDSLQQENIDGKLLWAHRNGACTAFPKKYYPNHTIFSKTGQPIPIPGCLGSSSFLCSASDGSKKSMYSSPHGAGRKLDRPEAREKFSNKEVITELKASGLKIYDYGKGNIKEESPKAFKNIYDIIKIIEEQDIAKSVVEMEPIAVLKGWT